MRDEELERESGKIDEMKLQGPMVPDETEKKATDKELAATVKLMDDAAGTEDTLTCPLCVSIIWLKPLHDLCDLLV